MSRTLVRQLCVMLLIEAASWCTLAWFAVGRGMPAWAAPLLVLGLIAGFRLFLVAQLFLVAHVWRMKRGAGQQIGALATLRLLCAETAAFFRLYLGYHLFEAWLGVREPRAIVPGQRPIVFVHGFMCNGGYFVPLLRFLAARGVGNCFTVNCTPPDGDIDRFAQQLAARVDEALARCGADKAILVGHSMGGLTSRAYVARQGGAGKVAKIITLGTPHHGTAHARFSPARDARQMRPGNPWLAELNAAQSAGVPTTSIYTFHDNVIAPQDNSHIDWGKNITFPGIGHLELSFSRPIQEAVLAELQDALR